jgi:hypothetical protein
MSSDIASGVAGNQRLTALVAAALFVMLAVEGVSIIALDQLFTVHVFVGLALIPVVVLKLVTTGYRMVRYYAGTAAYRMRGAPHAYLRALGPVVSIATVAVIGSGVALIFAGRNDALRGLHSASFIVFFAAMAVHVLAHMRETRRLVREDLPRRSHVEGARRRWLALGLSILTGAALATTVVTVDAGATHRQHHEHRDRGGDG